MRISELSAETGVPVPTLKYYLRERLLPPGELTSRTRAEYGEEHVRRVRLIRALVGAGGLDLAAVRRVLDAVDAPGTGRLDLLATAQDALVGTVMLEPVLGALRLLAQRSVAVSAASEAAPGE